MDVHEPEEYLDCDLYLAEDGRSGFAIKDSDELISVFSYGGVHAGDAMVVKAVEQGARRLDCFDTGNGFLPRLYGRHGFQPVARVRWNANMRPTIGITDGLDAPTWWRWPSPIMRQSMWNTWITIMRVA